MLPISNYRNIHELNYKEQNLTKYVCVLTQKIPVYDLENQKIYFVPRDGVKETILNLKKDRKLVELKKLLEAIKKDYWSEFKEELYRIIPVPIRFQYPAWVKLVEMSLNNQSSVSSVIRQILLDNVVEIVEYMKRQEEYNPEVLALLEERLKETRNIKERKSYSTSILFEEFRPLDELKDIGNLEGKKDIDKLTERIAEEIHSLARLALKRKLTQYGVSEELCNVFMEYLTIDLEFYAEFIMDGKELKLKIYSTYPFLPTWEDDQYKIITEFPIVVLSRFTASEIKHFSEVTGIPAFKGLSKDEIEALQVLLQTSSLSAKIKEKISGIKKLADLADVEKSVENIIRRIYKSYNQFDPITDQDYLIGENLDDWIGLLRGLLDVEIPITVEKDAVYVKGTDIKLDEVDPLSEYIAEYYITKIGINTEFRVPDDTSELDDDDLETMLKHIDEELAASGVAWLSRILAAEISRSVKSSEVFTTTLPRGFIELLRLFTGKSPKEIVVSELFKEVE